MKFLKYKKEKNRDSIRKIVARFSRGNARLQQGKYLTQEDIDTRLQNIRDRAIRHDN